MQCPDSLFRMPSPAAMGHDRAFLAIFLLFFLSYSFSNRLT